jgi:hypothetical protein
VVGTLFSTVLDRAEQVGVRKKKTATEKHAVSEIFSKHDDSWTMACIQEMCSVGHIPYAEMQNFESACHWQGRILITWKGVLYWVLPV